MATNVAVEKNNNESSANVIRRFQKRVQGAEICSLEEACEERNLREAA
jgi:hypothetical protein